MSNFCRDCFLNKIATPSDNITEDALVISDAKNLCEGCCEYKPIVLYIKDKTHNKILTLEEANIITTPNNGVYVYPNIPEHLRDNYFDWVIEKAIERFEKEGVWIAND